MFFADAGDIANASNATKKFLHTFKCLELINCCLDLCDLFTVFSLYYSCNVFNLYNLLDYLLSNIYIENEYCKLFSFF
jgi:hypothetical protein